MQEKEIYKGLSEAEVAESRAKYGMTKDCGLLVNSSRGIIYADTTERFAEVAGEKARELQQEMAEMLEKYNG